MRRLLPMAEGGFQGERAAPPHLAPAWCAGRFRLARDLRRALDVTAISV